MLYKQAKNQRLTNFFGANKIYIDYINRKRDFMKRLLCIILLLFILTGCSPIETSSQPDIKQDYITGVWLSFLEIDTLLQNNFTAEFNTVIANCKTRGITDIFVHVKPFCDSYYPSEYFPLRSSAASIGFDVLEYMIDICHQNNIRFHAWINPYRVKTSDNDVFSLPDNNPAKLWLTDDNADNDINVSTVDGVHLNPASVEVRALIIEGIREIIDNYKVDGIHFDDYFYPTTDQAFDETVYALYQETTQKPLSLEDWRRANINALISGVYTAIKFKNKDIVFSISPSASVTENYDEHYADIVAWIDSGCVDYIIPQLYFGFDYPLEEYRFDTLVLEWENITKKTDVKLLIGLACYKIGTEKEPDCYEWSSGKEVINSQVKLCNERKNISGHIFFSYSSMRDYL